MCSTWYGHHDTYRQCKRSPTVTVHETTAHGGNVHVDRWVYHARCTLSFLYFSYFCRINLSTPLFFSLSRDFLYFLRHYRRVILLADGNITQIDVAATFWRCRVEWRLVTATWQRRRWPAWCLPNGKYSIRAIAGKHVSLRFDGSASFRYFLGIFLYLDIFPLDVD